MKLAATALALITSSAVVRADTTFDEYSDVVRRRPAEVLREASCDLDVELRGAVATVEQRHRVVNRGADPLALSYEFDLPAGATLTGFALQADGAAEAAVAVPGTFNTVNVAARTVLGADPAVLVALPSGSASQYAVRLQPIAPDHEATITLRYTMLAQVRGGALRVVFPARPAQLAVCRGMLRAVAGPGTTIQGIRVAGKDAAVKGIAPFTLDASDVAIDVDLAFTGKAPVVWTQTEPLVDGWNATLVTVAAPMLRATADSPRRALFVIDGSRSMELVGRHNVAKVLRTIGGMLPVGTEIDAIVYDRSATRVLGAWKPATPETLASIEGALARRAAVNGSDLALAFQLAHDALADAARGSTLVIVISDGVLGDVDGRALTRALDAKTSTVDMLAVVLDPSRTRSPGAGAIASPVNLYGGSFAEVDVDELDGALGVVDEWLRPSWLELRLGGVEVSEPVRSGSGFTRTVIHRGPAGKFVLTGHGDAPIRIVPRVAPAAPVATLALAAATAEDFTGLAEPTDDDRDRAAKLRDRASARAPFASEHQAFAILTSVGKVARDRRSMIKGGGPYERLVTFEDPPERPGTSTTAATRPAASAIAKITLERMFRDQLQPRAYACYQRALGTSPKLAGTVTFDLRMGRGEITEVMLSGFGDPQLDGCLLDAAYAMQLPLPDFTINADDQTVARYPLTFNVADSRPMVVLGDADSSSPLDIDAIQGGVPVRAKKVKVDPSTPLGGLRPGH